jgi:hypothetical protein
MSYPVGGLALAVQRKLGQCGVEPGIAAINSVWLLTLTRRLLDQQELVCVRCSSHADACRAWFDVQTIIRLRLGVRACILCNGRGNVRLARV